MSMLSHDDPNVKHQALLCIQKLMVHHWEYLTKIEDGATSSTPSNNVSGLLGKSKVGNQTGKTVESKA